MIDRPPCDTLLLGIADSAPVLRLEAYLRPLRRTFTQRIVAIETPAACRVAWEQQIGELVDGWISPAGPLPENAGMFVIFPATVDALEALAGQMPDEPLVRTAVQCAGPWVVAPTLTVCQWEAPAVHDYLRRIDVAGDYVILPDLGWLPDEPDDIVPPSPEDILAHLHHVRMKELRIGYWEEATRERPLTPAEKRLRAILGAGASR